MLSYAQKVNFYSKLTHIYDRYSQKYEKISLEVVVVYIKFVIYVWFKYR